MDMQAIFDIFLMEPFLIYFLMERFLVRGDVRTYRQSTITLAI
jgi:hypothetical protein